MNVRAVLALAIGSALVVTSCTMDSGGGEAGATATASSTTTRPSVVTATTAEIEGAAAVGTVAGPLGDTRLLGELCETSACVADLVVLPDLHPLEVAVDVEVADTLGTLSIERIWTGTGRGIFGDGWSSLLDVTAEDNELSGPVGGQPLDSLDDGTVLLSDGSSLEVEDGRPTAICGVGALCTDIEWSDDAVRLTARSADEHWVELKLTDGVVSAATVWDGRSVAYEYEGGRLVSAGDTTYLYEDGKLASVDDGFVPRTFSYADGLLVEATDRDRTVWGFDSSDGQVRVASTSATTRTYQFDANKRLIGVVDDLNGMLLAREYVGAVLVNEQRPIDGVTMTMVEPGVMSVEQASNLAPARQVTYRYDNLGRLVETVEAAVSTSYGYDDLGRLVTVAHAGGVTRYEYDGRGLLQATTDPDGYRVEVARAPDGSIAAITDEATRTELEYDSLGRPTVQRDGPLESRAQYGLRGEVASTSDPGGAITEYRYDESGQLIAGSEFEAPGATPSVAPDGVGVVDVAVTNDGSEYRYSDGAVVRFDQFGRPTQTTTAADLTERRSYDENGRLATLVGFDGVTHDIAYTAAGRVASLDMDGDRYDFTWSGERLMTVQGPLGVDVSYDWNASGTIASATADGMEWTYRYDEEGNLAEVDTPHGAVRATWRNGLPTELSGPDGPVQTVEWTDGRIASLMASDDGFTFDYDAAGRLVTVADENEDALETYVYDDLGRMITATIDDEPLEVRYGDTGIDWISVGDTTEFWSRTGGDIQAIRLEDRSHDIEWVAPGVLGSVTLDGKSLIDVTANSMGQITRIATDDDVRAEFRWDKTGLVAATIGDDSATVERNALGLVERYESEALSYTAEYDGLALKSIVTDDVTIEYEVDDGDVAASTFDDGSDTVSIDWANGSRVRSFSSSEGNGAFAYTVDTVTEIRYDDRISAVDYNDEGQPSSEGTGREFLDDLFLDDGQPSLGASLPEVAPIIPALLRLPDDLGVSLPRPVTASDVVDAAVLAATPSVPSSIVAGGADGLVERAISTALGAAGQVDLAVDPVRSVQIAPLGESVQLTDVLTAAPTFVVTASVLDRLGPDENLFGRLFGGAAWTVGAVADGLSSIGRLAFNPVTRAVANVFFVVAAQAAAYCPPQAGCAVAIYVFGNYVNSTSPTDFLQRAFLAPVSGFFTDLVNLDINALITVASIVTIALGSPAFRTRVKSVACGLKRIVCLRRARFGEAADHARDAVGAGHPRMLRINRSGAEERRRDALRNIATGIGQDRDEYPPAFARRNGQAVSVRLIDSSANRSAGAYLQGQTRGLRDGARFFVLTI